MNKLEDIVPRHRDCRFFTPRPFPAALRLWFKVKGIQCE